MSAKSTRVLYTAVCAAPAAASAKEFVRLARDVGWTVRVIPTPMGERFVDTGRLAELTGDRVRIGFRMPGEPGELPKADAVVVAPATFNTINKWAAGITDTLATGLLCELTGAGVPILAVPLLKAELARHLAFARSLEVLRAMGVRVLFDPSAPPQARMPSLAESAGRIACSDRGLARRGGAEWRNHRDADSGSHAHAAAVACPRLFWPGQSADRKPGCPRSNEACAK